MQIIRNSTVIRMQCKVCNHAVQSEEDGAISSNFRRYRAHEGDPGMLVVNPADAVSAKKLLNEVVGYRWSCVR